MCLLCIEWERGKLTVKEAKNALAELVIFSDNDVDTEHLQSVANKLYELEPENVPE
jgi:hypothetical protein